MATTPNYSTSYPTATSSFHYGDPYAPQQQQQPEPEIRVSFGAPSPTHYPPATTVVVPYNTTTQTQQQSPYNNNNMTYSSPYAASSPTMSNYDRESTATSPLSADAASTISGSSPGYANTTLDPFALGVTSPPPPTTDDVNAPFASSTTTSLSSSGYYAESSLAAAFPQTTTTAPTTTTSTSFDYSESVENTAPTTTVALQQTITTTPSTVPRPDFERMKKHRVRGQIAAGTVGAVSGFILLGPIGALALGVTSNKVTKAVTKRREKRIKENYAQAVQAEQEAAAPPLPAAVLS